MVKFYFSSILLLCFLFNNECHSILGEHDQEYVEFGKCFQSVGYFIGADEEVQFGSGTLIETGLKELEGRVVLTAAHCLFDQPDGIQFVLDKHRSGGKSIIHPIYISFQEKHRPFETPYTAYDIALFVLHEPFTDSPLATLNFDLDVQGLIRMKYLAFAGFGVHQAGDEIKVDKIRRAGCLYADPELNTRWDMEYERVIECANGKDVKEIVYNVPAKSTVHLSSLCMLQPCGYPGSGDSGGALCVPYEKEIVGITSSTDRIDEGKGVFEDQMLVPYYEDYRENFVFIGFHKKWLEENFREAALKKESSATAKPIQAIQYRHDIEGLLSECKTDCQEYTCAIKIWKPLLENAKQVNSILLDNKIAIRDGDPMVRYCAAMRLFKSKDFIPGALGVLRLTEIMQTDPQFSNQIWNDLIKDKDERLQGILTQLMLEIIQSPSTELYMRIDFSEKMLLKTEHKKIFALVLFQYFDLVKRDTRFNDEYSCYQSAIGLRNVFKESWKRESFSCAFQNKINLIADEEIQEFFEEQDFQLTH